MFVQNNRIKYDKYHDTLYVFWTEPKYGYEDEVAPGIFIRKDDNSDEPIGLIITAYLQRNTEDFVKSVPVKIDFKQINECINT